VGDVDRHLATQHLLPADRFGHRVEGCGQFPQLVARTDRDALVEVAATVKARTGPEIWRANSKLSATAASAARPPASHTAFSTAAMYACSAGPIICSIAAWLAPCPIISSIMRSISERSPVSRPTK
jgi:hypothetical protein